MNIKFLQQIFDIGILYILPKYVTRIAVEISRYYQDTVQFPTEKQQRYGISMDSIYIRIESCLFVACLLLCCCARSMIKVIYLRTRGGHMNKRATLPRIVTCFTRKSHSTCSMEWSSWSIEHV